MAHEPPVDAGAVEAVVAGQAADLVPGDLVLQADGAGVWGPAVLHRHRLQRIHG